ncbi:histidine kinase [Kitasatospora sp. MMS16-BH015]|uniref:ATP-binding protein n=1 Tax=Kitasatospora sp. MMS16-BH015 TaxID=2018025 RepID=UPI000CA1D794|nr:ATP-binding protein [Kitasatospora sp. MMS16-BH015]AUG78855.1 histidine kinase [Kitasatospora sp. MMS16-BH015]
MSGATQGSREALPLSWHRFALSCHPAERAVPELRLVLRGALATLGLPAELAEATELVATELAGNAVRRAGGDFSFRLLPTPAALRIEVADPSARLPRTPPPAALATHGRGLPLLAALADDWGAVPTATGKTCWAVFHRPH